jgi:hypothetical protein
LLVFFTQVNDGFGVHLLHGAPDEYLGVVVASDEAILISARQSGF